MRAIAPKINQKKGNPSQPRSSDNEEEVSPATEGEENIDGPSKLRQQQLHIPMAGESIEKICKQQLDDTGHSEHKISNFPDLVEVSNFERDRVASESTSSKNHIPTLVQVSKSQENLSVNSLVDCNDSGRQLDKHHPISEKCILNRTLPVVDKSDR